MLFYTECIHLSIWIFNRKWHFLFLVGDHRFHSHPTVFWLHFLDGLHILDSNRNHRILCCLFLHTKDIWGHQDRLTRWCLLCRQLYTVVNYYYFYLNFWNTDSWDLLSVIRGQRWIKVTPGNSKKFRVDYLEVTVISTCDVQGTDQAKQGKNWRFINNYICVPLDFVLFCRQDVLCIYSVYTPANRPEPHNYSM